METPPGRHQSTQRKGHDTARNAILREAGNFTPNTVDVFRGRQIVRSDEIEEFWALKKL